MFALDMSMVKVTANPQEARKNNAQEELDWYANVKGLQTLAGANC